MRNGVNAVFKTEDYSMIRRMNREGYSADEIAVALGNGITARGLQHHMKNMGTTLRRGHGKRAHFGDNTVYDHMERERFRNGP